MTKIQKKTIKEEVIEKVKQEFGSRVYTIQMIKEIPKETKAYALLSLEEKMFSDIEECILKLIRQTLQRFIEETKIPEVKLSMDEDCPFCGKKKWECERSNCRRWTYNEALKREHQKQHQWLKENL